VPAENSLTSFAGRPHVAAKALQWAPVYELAASFSETPGRPGSNFDMDQSLQALCILRSLTIA
jgi:hypothetical protein